MLAAQRSLDSQKQVVIRAPTIMDIGQTFGSLLTMLQEVRRQVVAGNYVTIDLRHTSLISPPATLLLAAEVERCNRYRPRSVWGAVPRSEDVQATLNAFGFYEAIGALDEETEEWKGVARIQPGTGSPADIPRKLGLVSDLARQTWHDTAFCDRVHGALNEAMTNVIMHAYDEALIEKLEQPCIKGRWWVAGFSPPDSEQAWFMALDHGVGIPASAASKSELVDGHGSSGELGHDERVLMSLIDDENRSRTGLPQHGKGIPAMINLIREFATEGAIWIMSGKGGFMLEKRSGNSTSPGRIYQVQFRLPARLPGTLILWKVGSPIIDVRQTREAH
ncbi:MAG: hypothetical protein KKA16_14750 [Alphaproteobacteria bacterium]|nr:hypothetical protein [Alphaproteobacteria bacterium]MBU2379188.1 hypothetical protein [Alphaproteobacteria bacterium]